MVGMINPIIIVAVGLGTAFFLGLFGKKSTKIPLIFMFTALAFMTFVSWQWFFAFFTGRFSNSSENDRCGGDEAGY